ncbi:MAG: nucleoside monophosphate kinase [bacterium]|nr:nucleoside monophosphate kinase [bacterium]
MNVVFFFGLPGSGKGTQAEKLVERFGFFHFDTGKEIERTLYDSLFPDDPVIKRERAIFDSGVLNTPSWVEAIVRGRIRELSQEERSIVFSGSPRTLPEAEGITPLLEELYGKEALIPIFLDIPEAVSIARNSKRKICKNRVCARVAAWDAMPDAIACFVCGSALGRRSVDEPHIIPDRIMQYRTRTAPVLDFLRQRGIGIMEIDGTSKPEAVHKEIISRFHF